MLSIMAGSSTSLEIDWPVTFVGGLYVWIRNINIIENSFSIWIEKTLTCINNNAN